MKKYIATLVGFLCALAFIQSQAQCINPDTTSYHRVRDRLPGAVAFNSNKVAVASYDTSQHGIHSRVLVWNDQFYFVGGQHADDSVTVTGPCAVAFDTSGKLYVLQTLRPDSNILVFDGGLNLVGALSNSLSVPLQWSNPAAMVFDANNNLFVVSAGDSGSAYSGKLIRITDPLGACTRSVVLSGLNQPAGVVINNSGLYLSQQSSNKISRYNMASWLAEDSVTLPSPAYLASNDCRLYCGQQGGHVVNVLAANNLASGVVYAVTGFDAQSSVYGVAVDNNNDLFVSERNRNVVTFFCGAPLFFQDTAASPYTPLCEYSVQADFCSPTEKTYYPLPDSVLTSYAVPHTWISSNPFIASVDTNGLVYAAHEGRDTVWHIVGTDTTVYTFGICAGGSVLCQGSVSSFFLQASPANILLSAPDVYSSSNPGVATVDATGMITAVSPGGALITHIKGFDTLMLPVNVVANTGPVVAPIYINTDSGNVYNAYTFCEYNIEHLNISPSWGIINFTTSNLGVANVDRSFNIWPRAAGTATYVYTISNGCYSSSGSFTITVLGTPDTGIITGGDSVCRNTTMTLTESLNTGVWRSLDTAVATVDGSGSVYGVSGGNTVIEYLVTNECGVEVASHAMQVDTINSVGTITGIDTICIGDSTILADVVPGGYWRAANLHASVLDSMVRGLSGGTDTIFYVIKNACIYDSAIHMLLVDTTATGHITGDSIVCVGASILLTDTFNNTGTWMCSNSNATISGGTLNGLHAGLVTVSYVVTGPCSSDTLYKNIEVKALPVAGVIAGADSLCPGASTLFTAAGSPGTTTSWASTVPGHVSVSAMGQVTALAPVSSANILFIASNSCGADTVRHLVGVRDTVNAGTISGPAEVCVGSTFHYTYGSGTPGGTWSSVFGYGSIDHSGNFTGLSGSTSDVVLYTVSNVCNTSVASIAVAIDDYPVAGTIYGPSDICINDYYEWFSSDGNANGVWDVSDWSLANIDGWGDFSPVMPGYVVVSYSISNACGSDISYLNVSIDDIPVPAAIAGPSVACSNAVPLYYYPSVFGGTWGSTNTSVAAINASGTVYAAGAAGGSTVITYTLDMSACGPVTSYLPLTVAPGPDAGAVTGLSTVCAGNTITLTDATATSPISWTSSVPSSASVSGGVVTGITGGTSSVIVATATNSCGTDTAQHTITVPFIPAAGAITGPAAVCVGGTITLGDATATAPGVWTSTLPGAATVSGIGVVTGISAAAGPVSIVYTVPANMCGPQVITSMPLTINPLPLAGTVSGADSVCVGSSVSLVSLGASAPVTWSSSVPSAATVSGGSATGITGGLQTVITATATNTCGSATAQHLLYVNALPFAGTIGGTTTVCVGGMEPLFDATGTPGGIWGTTNSAAAIVDGSGIVTGISNTAGPVSIVYTVPANMCGPQVVTSMPLTINPLPLAGTVSGADSVCVGSSVSLVSLGASAPVTWSSSVPSAATVSGGSATGITGGLQTVITATATNTCGSATAQHLLYVNALPFAGTIGGTTTVCVGGMEPLFDATGTPGGIWGTTNSAAAIVDGSGIVTGISNTAGPVSITYLAVTYSCGTALASYPLIVSTVPVVPAITGAASVCTGTSVSLHDATAGGTWTVSNGHAAIGSGTGVLNGISMGIDTVKYALANICGTSTINFIDTVLPVPSAGVISPATVSVCAGDSVVLVDAGGVYTSTSWSTTGSGVSTLVLSPAAVSVHGISYGNATLTFSSVNSCGVAATSRSVHVDSIMLLTPIAGNDTLCHGITETLHAHGAVAATWWLSNSNANLGVFTDTSATITSVTTGAFYAYYSAGNSCGVFTDSLLMYVGPVAPVAGTIVTGSTYVCAGSTLTLADPSATAGGTWSVTNAAASVSGNVLTGVAAGMDTIAYSVTNYCGAAAITAPIQVIGLPHAGEITGPGELCAGTAVTLFDTSATGTWHSSNGDATVAGGIVTGAVSGVDTISYRVTNVCGADSAIFTIVVDTLPVAGSIAGPDTVCIGVPVTFTDSVTGGVWSATNSYCTVDSGVVTGITMGIDTILYITSNGCGVGIVTRSVIVSAQPSAGIITGADTVCQFNTVALTNTTASLPGVWSSSNTAAATVNASGVVSGIAGGSTIISYAVSGTCGDPVSAFDMTVLSDSACLALTVKPDTKPAGEFLTTFPNPNNGTFTLMMRSSVDQPVKVVINDLVGRKVAGYTVRTNQAAQVDLQVAAGIYYVTATIAEHSYIARVIITD